MKLSLQTSKKALNKAYLKEKVHRANMERFKQQLQLMLGRINENETEEHLKNIVADFLKDTGYKGLYEINTKERNDLVIHTGKTTKEAVGVLIEVKKPANKAEMISLAKPNTKALHELILYYFRERTEHGNTDLKYLIATNIYEWYLFDEVWFEKNIFRNTGLKQRYENWKHSGNDTKFFYDHIAKPFLDTIEEAIPCTYFNLADYTKIVKNNDNADDNKLVALYKTLSPVHLLKQPFANDSNSLDTRFYAELLHIIGLEEVKEGSKKLIRRKATPDPASLLENTMQKLRDRESLRNIQQLSAFGSNSEEQLCNVALELCLTWVNRILFLKLLEAQLVNYHKGSKTYRFLDATIIFDFDELSNLFFGVLAEKSENRRPDLQQKFSKVPYLNSSLFERTTLERVTIDISSLDNRMQLPLYAATVLKNEKGSRLTGHLTTLPYLFRFLDAYDFTSEGGGDIQEENKNLINASVLGLIFEKINGYRDGSFFTPGFVTMYMCRETLRRAVVQKFAPYLSADERTEPPTLNDVYDIIGSKISKEEANTILNSLTICDPAVGSGHFLVSALNEMIAIKSELKILLDRHGKTLRDYEVEVVNDELVVTDEDGNPFEYRLGSKESQRVQEALFHEKETLIEHCLFGVDINPNSVKICRLRLWIELLKNAYYQTAANGSLTGELETLPNIDINIKTGNSLISRFALDADVAAVLKRSKWTIDSYKTAVQAYRNAESKEEKREMEVLIETIKRDFRTEISVNDPKVKKLSKLRGELFNLSSTKELFNEGARKSSDTKKKIAALSKDITKLESEIEEIKNNKIYENAFEWRFEFPEALDKEGKFVGFDVVIGNPPYVQLQKLPIDVKPALEKQQYKTYKPTGDLYQLFYELGANILKNAGHLCYITSNKWMRTDYGEGTRSYLAKEYDVKMVVDFGMAQMFDSATTYTNILLLTKEKPNTKIPMCRIKDDYKLHIHLKDYINNNIVQVSNPGSGSWIAYEKKQYELIKRIEAQGVPLKDWDIKINRGILTGFNEAFIIDTETRNRLVAEDPRSAEIIKPILRGEDIKAYIPQWAGKWLIGTFPALNIDITEYPAIEVHLSKYKKRLEPKPKGFNGSWTGRKSGSYKWFETQDSISYYEDFLKPKIIYPNITKYLPFVYDKGSFFTNDLCFIITGERIGYLTAFLNSKIFRFAFREYFPELLGDSRKLNKVFFEAVTVKPIADDDWYSKKIAQIQENKLKLKDATDLENEIDEKLFDLYHLTKADRDLILFKEANHEP